MISDFGLAIHDASLVVVRVLGSQPGVRSISGSAPGVGAGNAGGNRVKVLAVPSLDAGVLGGRVSRRRADGATAPVSRVPKPTACSKRRTGLTDSLADCDEPDVAPHLLQVV